MKLFHKIQKKDNAALTALTLIVAVAVALFVGTNALHSHTMAGFFTGGDNVVTIADGWVINDGENEYTVTLPSRDDLGITSDHVVLTHTLPETLGDEEVMLYRTSRQLIKIYIDGNEVYSFGDTDGKSCGKVSGSIWNIVPLEEEYAGKEIKLDITSPYVAYRNTFNTFYIGEYTELFSLLLKNHGLNFTMSLVLIILGVLMVGVYIFCTVFRISGSRQPFWAGLFSIFVGFWNFSECKVTQFLINDVNLNTQVDFILLAAMVIPMLFYFDHVEGYHFHRFFVALTAIAEFNVFIQVILQFCGILDFYEMMIISHVILAVAALFITTTGLYIYVSEKDKKMFPFVVTLIILAIAGTWEVTVVYLTGFANGALLGGAVFLLVIVCMGKTMESLVEVLSTGREAVKESAAKTMFLANMSHEIRTPMNAICAMSEMLTESDSMGDKDKEHAKTINVAALHLLEIINDILDYTKISADKLEITETNYSFARFLSDTYNPISVIAEQKKLGLLFAVSPNVPENLCGDGGKCRQILINILNNAVKYTKRGYVKLTVDFEKIDSEKGKLIFEVADTGIGISKENQKKLFDAYSQVNLKRERSEESTGLGLAISKGLANLLGGDIEVISNEGWGSIFTVIVVQKYTDDKTYIDVVKEAGGQIDYEDMRIVFSPVEIPDSSIEGGADKIDASAAKVLVVDDNSTNLRIMREMLSLFNVKPILVSGGIQAIAAVKTKHFDLIYMDHMMPGIDGVETTQEIRKMTENGGDKIKIVALTANAMKGAREDFLKNGFDDYLSKPVSMERIKASLLDNLPKEMIKH